MADSTPSFVAPVGCQYASFFEGSTSYLNQHYPEWNTTAGEAYCSFPKSSQNHQQPQSRIKEFYEASRTACINFQSFGIDRDRVKILKDIGFVVEGVSKCPFSDLCVHRNGSLVAVQLLDNISKDGALVQHINEKTTPAAKCLISVIRQALTKYLPCEDQESHDMQLHIVLVLNAIQRDQRVLSKVQECTQIRFHFYWKDETNPLTRFYANVVKDAGCALGHQETSKAYLICAPILAGLWSITALRGLVPQRSYSSPVEQEHCELEFSDSEQKDPAAFVEKAKRFLGVYCPGWSSKKWIHMLPPLYQCKFTEPTESSASGYKNLQGNVEATVKQDKSECMLYTAMEHSAWSTTDGMIALSQFTIDDQKGKLISQLCPAEPLAEVRTECDLLALIKDAGIVIFEVKGTDGRSKDDTIKQAYNKAKEQLERIRELLEKISKQFCEIKLEVSDVVLVAVFPLLSKDELRRAGVTLGEDDERQEQHDIVLCTKEDFAKDQFDEWFRKYISYSNGSDVETILTAARQHIMYTDLGTKSLEEAYEEAFRIQLGECNLSVAPRIEKERSEKLYQRMAPILFGLWGLKHSAETSKVYMSGKTRASFIRQESDKVQEHSLVDKSKKQQSYLRKTTVDARPLYQLKQRIFFLTPEQMDAWNGGDYQIISGTAGVGKTILLMGKIKQMSDEGKSQIIVFAPPSMDQKYHEFAQQNNLDMTRIKIFNAKTFFESYPAILEQLKSEKEKFIDQTFGHALGKLSGNVTATTMTELPIEDLLSILEQAAEHSFRSFDLEEMRKLFTGSCVFIDDALSYNEENLLSFLMFVIKQHQQVIPVCWIAQDPKQLFLLNFDYLHSRMEQTQDSLCSITCRGQSTRKEVRQAIKQDIQRLVKRTIFKIFAYTPALLTTLEKKVGQRRLTTVLRSSKNVFDYWYNQSPTLEEIFADDNWLNPSAVIGHNIIGMGIRTYSLPDPKDEREGDPIELLAQHIADHIDILCKQYSTRNQSLTLRHFAILLNSTMQLYKDTLVALIMSTGLRVGSIKEQITSADDILAVDQVENCISMEWPVVIYVSVTSDKAVESDSNFSVVSDYFAHSRCLISLIWLHVDME